MVLTAGRATDSVGLSAPPDELFKFCAAVVARILKDRHDLKLTKLPDIYVSLV
jgi:hypothetical protein